MIPPAARLSAYPETLLEFYEPAGPEPVLEVDLRLPPPAGCAARFALLGMPGRFAVITAHNPAGDPDKGIESVDAPANAGRTRRLLRALGELGRANPVRADGCSPDRTHRETGFAVDLDEAAARALARRFDQDAIFWWDGGAFWIVGTGETSPERQVLPLPGKGW